MVFLSQVHQLFSPQISHLVYWLICCWVVCSQATVVFAWFGGMPRFRKRPSLADTLPKGYPNQKAFVLFLFL